MGGKLNITENCLDRHLDTRGDKTAILWEGDDPKDTRAITYRQLHEEVCRMANVLKDRGVPREAISISAYWALGRVEDQFQAEKREAIGKIDE